MSNHNNRKKNEEILPKKPKVQRDANGKLIITYKSRLLEPKKLDADWRAKKLEQYEREHNDKVAGGKKSMLGYFGDARSASAGDFFVEKAKREAKEARGRGPQLRSGARHTKVVTGTFGKFVSNASGDPYLSPSQIRAAYLKKQKAKAIQAVPFAAGKKKSKMVTDTFSRPRFLSVVDGDDDIGSLKEKIKNAKATMASPSPKFERFKQPNFKTAPVKKGGPGTSGVLMPVYGEGDNPLKRINQYIESPYDAAREAELARKREHEEKMASVHGEAPKPFSSRVSRKGVETFSKDVELYGEDKETTLMVQAKLAKEAAAKAKAEEEAAAKEDESPMPEWRPSNPPKKMQYADKKAFFGGSNFEYVPDPVPEFQPGAHHPKKKTEEGAEDSEDLPSWKPNGAHSHSYKGTSSVVLNKAQLRHQIYADTSRTSRSTSRATTR